MATIIENLSINPGFINFGVIPVKTTQNVPVKITNNTKAAMVVRSLEVNPSVNLSINPNRNITFKPGESKQLTLKFDAGKDPGFIQGSIVVKTNMPNFPDKVVSVNAEVIAK